MATPATLNTWLDQLSSSILNQHPATAQKRNKLQVAFRRRVNRHSYGRTNQFEVSEKLDGLEEKFQILTLDNLSDALHQRRSELKDYEHHWLPDALDLLLHLSGDPARISRVIKLYHVSPKIGSSPPLKWKDILADDPIDRNDLLWRVPDFKDHSDSGYDDEDEFSNTPSSPPSARKSRTQIRSPQLTQPDKLVYDIDVQEDAVDVLQEIETRNVLQSRRMTELQLVREVIFVLRGLPSTLFVQEQGVYHLNSSLSVRGIVGEVLHHIAERIFALRLCIDQISQWLTKDSECLYITTMKSAAELCVQHFSAALDRIQENLVDSKENFVVSITQVIDAVEDLSLEVQAIAHFLELVEPQDPINFLEVLYKSTSDVQLLGEPRSYQALLSILLPSLTAYLQPVWRWIESGAVEQEPGFFVKVRATKINLRNLWNEQFTAERTGSDRPLYFLLDSLDKVLSCGKTAAFIHHLELNFVSMPQARRIRLQFETSLKALASDLQIPFAAAFESLWQEHISSLLQEHTANLKFLLDTNCGFTYSFDAIDMIYLGQGGAILADVEDKIFAKIDRCTNSWNDRFLIADLLEEAFEANGSPRLADAITVRSTYTSSETMQNRRRSVHILNAVAFEYNPPWPIANIIGDDSMGAYQRVALILMQVRRAKYCLERTGYTCASTLPLSEQVGLTDQKFAQLQAFTLGNFVNTLYSHLATTIIPPLTKSMRSSMVNASTMNDMIEAHQQYITRLELSCLAAPRLKVLRQALLTLLDFCIRFSDLVSDLTAAKQDSSDHGTGSFRSARSYHRTHSTARDVATSDSDDDYDGMGNAVEDVHAFRRPVKATTSVKELRELKEQFTKQLDFFVAGLRGASRGAQHAQDLEGLADRLTWNTKL